MSIEGSGTATAKNYSCMLEQNPCFIEFNGNRIEVLFDVDKVTAEQAFNMQVSFQSTQRATQVTGYLEGIDMFMGKIPLFFEKQVSASVDKSISVNNLEISTDKSNVLKSILPKQVFQGEVLVGSCSEQKMQWRMWLIIKTNDNKEHKKMFTFVSYRS